MAPNQPAMLSAPGRTSPMSSRQLVEGTRGTDLGGGPCSGRAPAYRGTAGGAKKRSDEECLSYVQSQRIEIADWRGVSR
jgi:hypothetical protein